MSIEAYRVPDMRITRGNFRLIDRLFTQVERVMKINELSTITDEQCRGLRIFGADDFGK
ncbi:hypothetical protein ACQCSU_21590 (plasmid) [Pseudarthrobacter sp. O4]|uniref:hypothetical protein n=1 Tax=Pseudarthrobacter sp. O4 TaxID=3418417 RepID=UPI003CF35426